MEQARAEALSSCFTRVVSWMHACSRAAALVMRRLGDGLEDVQRDEIHDISKENEVILIIHFPGAASPRVEGDVATRRSLGLAALAWHGIGRFAFTPILR